MSIIIMVVFNVYIYVMMVLLMCGLFCSFWYCVFLFLAPAGVDLVWPPATSYIYCILPFYLFMWHGLLLVLPNLPLCSAFLCCYHFTTCNDLLFALAHLPTLPLSMHAGAGARDAAALVLQPKENSPSPPSYPCNSAWLVVMVVMEGRRPSM